MTVLVLLRDASIGAIITAFLILLTRLIFGKLLTAKAKYYLWLLLALRLLLPVTPGSPTSLMNYVPRGGMVLEPVPATEESTPAETTYPNIEVTETEPAAQIQPAQEQTVSIPSEPANAAPAPRWPSIILRIWLIGMATVLTVYLVLYIITERKLMSLPSCGDGDTQREFLHLKQHLHVSDRIKLVSGDAGMLGGLFHPTMVIPVERRGEEAAPIMVHELMHYKYGDLWLYLLFRILTAVYWFHPLVWICFWRARQDSEKACDERVLESELLSPYTYAQMLYEEGCLHSGFSPLPRTTFGGGGRLLKTRMQEIARYRKHGKWVALAAGILALIITACGITSVTNQEPVLSSSASVPEENAEDSAQLQPPREDMDAFLEDIQPFYGHFGWTYEQHVAAGLINPAVTEENVFSPICTEYITEVQAYGESLEAVFVFSCTQFTQNTTGRQVLTELFVELPRGIQDEQAWIDEMMAPKENLFFRNVLGRYYTLDTVGPNLTEEQREYVARNAYDDGVVETFEAGLDYVDRWYLEVVSYRPDSYQYYFNGTGAALYLTRSDAFPETASDLFDPYELENGTITFRDTFWGMGVEDVFSVEELDREAWRYYPDGKVIHPRPNTAPLPDHPEVTDINYCFNFSGPDLAYGLDLVIVRYDPEQVSYEDLIQARTQFLGDPSYSGEDKTVWETSEGYTLMLLPDEKELTERLVSRETAFVSNAGAFLDVEAYMADLQPPNGHFGWTYAQHVEAGLLAEGLRQEPTEDGYMITGTATLGGYNVEIDYLFGPTLVSEEMVLRQAFVKVPEDVKVRQWAESFWDPRKDKLMEDSSLRFTSPVTLNLLLPEETQQEIINTINSQQDRTDATLSNWSLLWQGYMPEAGIWQYNGTGAALYVSWSNLP